MGEIAIGPAEPRDHGQIADLCSRCLGVGPGYFSARLAGDPSALPGFPLVARDGDRVVSTVHALGFDLGFGAARVPCGGIANVATEPAFRKRGLARRLLESLHTTLDSRGYPVSLLSTEIPDFYRPLGYEVWPHAETHLLKLRPPTEAGPAPAVRPIEARDRDALIALREAGDHGYAGTMIPETSRWTARQSWTAIYPREEPALSLVAIDSAGRPEAWIRATANTEHGWSKVLEFGAAPGANEAVRALARAYLAAAFALGVRGLQYPAPCRTLGNALTPFADASAGVTARWLMLRIADPAALPCDPTPLISGNGSVFWEIDSF